MDVVVSLADKFTATVLI